MENTVSLSILSVPVNWDAALGLLTDRQGIIATTDINGLPCKWPNCNLGFARTMEQP